MTGRGFKIARIFGIPVYLDWTFFLIVPLFAFLISGNFLTYAGLIGLEAEARELVGVTQTEQGVQLERPTIALLFGALMTIGLYLSVLVHEFGHALTARVFGVRTERVTLWFLGGVAGFERMPRQPGAEAVVAIVGPLVSFAVAGVLAIAFVVVPDGLVVTRLTVGALSVLNLILATFNLIPALPLDGGRVLRSLLALGMSYVKATRISAGLSKGLAALLVLIGLFNGGLMLIAVAIFIWFAVNAETRQSEVEAMLKGIRVSDLMSRDVAVLDANASVQDMLNAVRSTRHQGFPVVDANNVVLGMVALRDLDHDQVNPHQPVREVMREGCLRTRADELAMTAFERMARRGFERCAVTDDGGRLTGLITKGDLVHHMRMQSLRRQSPSLFPAPVRPDADENDPYRDPYVAPRPS